MNDSKLLSQKWYALYVRTNHEKKIPSYLDKIGIDSFLPTITELRQWSDRKKKVIKPLFANYIFVFTSLKNQIRIREIPGVICFVGIGKHPSPVPDTAINSIRKVLSSNCEITSDHFSKGDLVRIVEGSFAGVEGRYIRTGAKNLLTIEVELLNRAITLELKPYHLKNMEKVGEIGLSTNV